MGPPGLCHTAASPADPAGARASAHHLEHEHVHLHLRADRRRAGAIDGGPGRVHLQHRFPGFPFRNGIGSGSDGLPPLWSADTDLRARHWSRDNLMAVATTVTQRRTLTVRHLLLYVAAMALVAPRVIPV